MPRVLAFIAFVVVTGFLGILVWKVPSPDLIVIVALTVGLIAYDFATSGRKS